MPGALSASSPIGKAARWIVLLCSALTSPTKAWAAGASARAEASAEASTSRANTVQLHLPEGFTLAEKDKFLVDLCVGLEQDGLLVDADPQSHQLELVRAVVRVTEPEPEVLRIQVVAQGGNVSLTREVRRSELPTSGQGLALAVLVEELVRASLVEEAKKTPPSPKKQLGPVAPVPPRSAKVAPRTRSPGTPLERYLGLGPLGLVFSDGSLYFGGSGALGLGTRVWRVELTFTYARLLEVATRGGSAHGEVTLGGASWHFNLVSVPQLWLGPFANLNGGISTFWAESYSDFAAHSLRGPFVSAGGGLRLGLSFRPVELNLDVALGAPIAGVTGTFDRNPISSTATAHGSALLRLGARL
jgi:hypothetical protein